MPNVLIRDVPDDVHTELFHRASNAGQSLQLYLELELERLARTPALEFLAALPVMRYPTLPLLLRVFALKKSLTPYDAVCVALAEALNCPLVTNDGRLAHSPGIRCEVQLLN